MTEPVLKLPLRVEPSICHGQAVINNADDVFIAGFRLDQAKIIVARVNSWDAMHEALRKLTPLIETEADSLHWDDELKALREALALAEKGAL